MRLLLMPCLDQQMNVPASEPMCMITVQQWLEPEWMRDVMTTVSGRRLIQATVDARDVHPRVGKHMDTHGVQQCTKACPIINALSTLVHLTCIASASLAELRTRLVILWIIAGTLSRASNGVHTQCPTPRSVQPMMPWGREQPTECRVWQQVDLHGDGQFHLGSAEAHCLP